MMRKGTGLRSRSVGTVVLFESCCRLWKYSRIVRSNWRHFSSLLLMLLRALAWFRGYVAMTIADQNNTRYGRHARKQCRVFHFLLYLGPHIIIPTCCRGIAFPTILVPAKKKHRSWPYSRQISWSNPTLHHAFAKRPQISFQQLRVCCRQVLEPWIGLVVFLSEDHIPVP